MAEIEVLTGASAPKTFIESQIASGPVDYGEYATAADAPVTEDTLSMLRRLAQEQMDLERLVAVKEKELSEKVKELEAIRGGEFATGRLPTLMSAHGLPKFEFIDGTTGQRFEIAYHDKLRVALPTMQAGNKMVKDPEKCRVVYDWFRSINLGGIITKELVVPVGLETDEFVATVAAEIKERHPDLDIAVLEEINPARLRSQVTKRIEAGKDVHELLKVTQFNVSAAKLK